MTKLLTLLLILLSVTFTSQSAYSAASPTCTRKIAGLSGKLYILKTSFKKSRLISISRGGRSSFPSKIAGTKFRYKASGDKKWYTLTADGKIFRAGTNTAVGTHNCNLIEVIAYIKTL